MENSRKRGKSHRTADSGGADRSELADRKRKKRKKDSGSNDCEADNDSPSLPNKKSNVPERVGEEKNEVNKGGSETQKTDNNSDDPHGAKRKRSQRPKPDDESLPDKERERRQRQRELQEMARRLKAEGKVYKPPKKRPATATAKRMAGVQRKARQKGVEDAVVEVIVVPIFWNAKVAEKRTVLKATETIVELLKQAGVQADMDATTALSPGQKFGFWEAKGVMVRVECGPRDAAANECVLAVSKEVGQVAEKQTWPVGGKLLQEIGNVLGRELSAVSLDVEMPDADEPAAAKQAARQAPNYTPVSGLKRSQLTSGDDLDGDFCDLSTKETKSKRKKQKY